MNEDEEADADDPASEVDTVRTRYKMRKDLKSIVITRKKQLATSLEFLSREIFRKPTRQNFAGSFSKSRNLTLATLNRESCRFTCRYGMPEIKLQICYDRSKQIHIEFCKIF